MKTLDINSPGLVVNLKGIIVDINNAALDMFHYMKTELIGKPIDLLMPNSVREKHATGFSDFMRGNKIRSSCIRVNGLTKEQELLYLTICVDKTPNGAIAVISNSTTKEVKEQELLQKLG